jgi:hypothetical protein
MTGLGVGSGSVTLLGSIPGLEATLCQHSVENIRNQEMEDERLNQMSLFRLAKHPLVPHQSFGTALVATPDSLFEQLTFL